MHLVWQRICHVYTKVLTKCAASVKRYAHRIPPMLELAPKKLKGIIAPPFSLSKTQGDEFIRTLGMPFLLPIPLSVGSMLHKEEKKNWVAEIAKSKPKGVEGAKKTGGRKDIGPERNDIGIWHRKNILRDKSSIAPPSTWVDLGGKGNAGTME